MESPWPLDRVSLGPGPMTTTIAAACACSAGFGELYGSESLTQVLLFLLNF